MGLKLGIRTLRVKVYPITYFGISDDEAEKFAVRYDNLDLWNFNKQIDITKSQIEKRVRYFHIMYIPLFSLGIDWTTRKKDGLLYCTTESCEKKINKRIGKSKSPWYINLIPMLFSLSFIMILLYFLLIPLFMFYTRDLRESIKSPFIERSYKKEIKAEYNENSQGIALLDTNFFIEFQAYNTIKNAKDGLFPKYSYSSYGKILAINDDLITMGFIHEDSIFWPNEPLRILKERFFIDSLELKQFRIDSLRQLVPSNHEDINKLSAEGVEMIVSRVGTLN